MSDRTYLVLENGSIYDGRGFGFPAVTAGRVVSPGKSAD